MAAACCIIKKDDFKSVWYISLQEKSRKGDGPLLVNHVPGTGFTGVVVLFSVFLMIRDV